MRRWDIVAAVGILLPASVVIGLYIYIGSFNRMLGDDYCSMYFGERLGLLRSIWYWYNSWHGGFSASAADWLISVGGPGAFPFHTFVFLSAWLVFAAVGVKKALDFRGYLSLKFFAALFLAVLLVFTTLRLSPDIIESVFWWGGARGYLSPLIFSMLYFALYGYFITLPARRVKISIWVLVSFGLAFLTGGFSETFTPVLVVLLAGLAAIRWRASKFSVKDASTLFLGAGFLGALCSLFVMVLAPGNSLRQEYFPVPPDIFTVLRVASASYLAFLFDIFTSPQTLTGLLGSTFGSVWLGMRMNRESGVAPLQGRWIAAILFAGFILAFGCFPPPVYGTSEPPPERTLMIPAFFLVACLIAAGFVFGEWLIGRNREMMGLSRAFLVIACSLIVFSSSVSFQNLYSMRSEHVLFARQWDEVDDQIREAKISGLQQVNIPSLENWADAPFPTDNPKYWPNVCYSKFYDINIIAPQR